MAKTLRSCNLTLSALLFVFFPSLVGADTCFGDGDPHELSKQKDRLMDGDYTAFFATLSQPSTLGSGLDFTESELETLEGAYPSGFENCTLLLDKSTSEKHRRQLFVFFGNGYGIFLYWEAFQIAERWQIWDYRLSTSFPEIREKID